MTEPFETTELGSGMKLRPAPPARARSLSLSQVCQMKEQFKTELEELAAAGVAGRKLSLADISKLLLEAPKPPLDFEPKQPPERGFAASLKKSYKGMFGPSMPMLDDDDEEDAKKKKKKKSFFGGSKKEKVAAAPEPAPDEAKSDKSDDDDDEDRVEEM